MKQEKRFDADWRKGNFFCDMVESDSATWQGPNTPGGGILAGKQD